MSVEFQRAVLRELDQIRQGFERTVSRLEARDEERDSEVSDLKLQVGLLRAECRRNLKRDAGLVSVPTVLVSAIVAIAQWLATPHATPHATSPVQPPHAPTAQVK